MNIFEIILLAILIIVIIIVVYIIYKIRKNLKIVTYTLVNDLQCGKPKCDIQVKNIPVLVPPANNLGDLNGNTAFHQSLINFMASVIQTSLLGKNYIPLTGMKLVKQIDTPKDKLMAVLATIDSSPETLIIAIRGTQNLDDLLEDTHLAQTPFPIDNSKNPLVHQGFFNVYNAVKDGILDNIPGNTRNIIVTGHSLGSAVAVLIGLILKKTHSAINTRVVTYACPRVGNEDLANIVDATIEHIRIVNNSDAVPGLPAAVSPNKLNPPSPWLYYHSGTPITFNLNWQSVVNNHMIPVYMKFINQLK
jgi:triacylglycerol lipase